MVFQGADCGKSSRADGANQMRAPQGESERPRMSCGSSVSAATVLCMDSVLHILHVFRDSVAEQNKELQNEGECQRGDGLCSDQVHGESQPEEFTTYRYRKACRRLSTADESIQVYLGTVLTNLEGFNEERLEAAVDLLSLNVLHIDQAAKMAASVPPVGFIPSEVAEAANEQESQRMSCTHAEAADHLHQKANAWRKKFQELVSCHQQSFSATSTQALDSGVPGGRSHGQSNTMNSFHRGASRTGPRSRRWVRSKRAVCFSDVLPEDRSSRFTCAGSRSEDNVGSGWKGNTFHWASTGSFSIRFQRQNLSRVSTLTRQADVKKQMGKMAGFLEEAAQRELEEVKMDLEENESITAESELVGTQGFMQRFFCQNQFLHLVELNDGVCPMVIEATILFKDVTSGPVLSTRAGRFLASGWRFILVILLVFCSGMARPAPGYSDHGKKSPCSGDAPLYRMLIPEMLFLSGLLLSVFVALHSTPASLLQKTVVTYDAVIVILSGLRFSWSLIMVYRFRAKHCLPEEVDMFDRLSWYLEAVTVFIFCMLPVLMDPLRVPRGVKVLAYLLVICGMLQTYVRLLQRILDEDRFPEYHDEGLVHLWIQPLKPLDHQISGFAMILMFYARAFFWQVIMGEDFTLLRGRFRLAI